MERDFMGLSTVKQEIPEESTDPAVARSSAIQWSFSNKLHPHEYISFKVQENNNYNNNNKPKIGFESLASAGLMTITTTTEFVDIIHQPRNTQIGAQYSSSQTADLISTVNLNPAQITSPNISTHHVPTGSGLVGTTELRGTPRTSPGPAQLTIFYAGSVCVYNNISPEKAEAIMLLAGNAPPVTPSTTSTASPVHEITKSPNYSLDTFVNANNCHGNFSSAIPITSCGTTYQSVGVFNDNTNETTTIRSTGVLKPPSNAAELSKIVTSHQESRRPPSHNLSAVPQARRASLGRFLEKRKERVMSASPYGNNKETSQHMTTPGCGNWTFSINSSDLLPATN
ncbi:hypothetical protein HAX54_015272 [Datura stramonium]|uniref:Protein TIFY n=1 Tax=Datura stramonium TaxID=4076 RepID=A0ABS8RZ93_DATST|nr:hypothetical protein [Datura stramonium]